MELGNFVIKILLLINIYLTNMAAVSGIAPSETPDPRLK
jgi:hypothetical protein